MNRTAVLTACRIVMRSSWRSASRCTVNGVRTTVDLPDDLHAVATAIARDAGTSLTEVVTWLLRAGLGTEVPVRVSISPRTGLKVGVFAA